jgi:hypothetical protein
MSTEYVPRPGAYPYHAENIVTTLPTVGEGVGYVANSVANSKIANAIGKSAARWIQQIDLASLQVSDLIDNNSGVLVGGLSLEYLVGASIVGAEPTQTPVVIGAGARMSFDEYVLSIGGANPATFAPNSRIWIYGSISTLEPGSYLGVRLETVALATPAAPGVGEITLGGVDTDGTTITANVPSDASATVPIAPQLSMTGDGLRLGIYCTTAASGDAGLVIESTGGGPGASISNDSLTDAALSLVNSGGGPALECSGPISADVIGGTTITAQRLVSNGNTDALPSLSVDPSTGAPSTAIVGSGSTTAGQAALLITGGAGRAIEASITGTVPGIAVTCSSSGAGVSVSGSGSGACVSLAGSSTGECLSATSTGGGNAINATGGTGTSRAGNFTATATGADAIQCATAAAATSAAAAVRATANGSGNAIVATAVDGYAATFQSDTTSPITAPTRWVPQNADPSSPLQGDLSFNSARGSGGKFRVRTVAQHESVHSTAKGHVFAFGAAASGSTAGGSGNVSLAQISAEETGDVLVTATGTLAWTIDNGQCTITVVDVTSGVTLATSIERGVDVAGASVTDANNSRTFAVMGIRTLPNTTTRTFAVVITANTGTVTYSNVICRVDGVQ